MKPAEDQFDYEGLVSTYWRVSRRLRSNRQDRRAIKGLNMLNKRVTANLLRGRLQQLHSLIGDGGG